MPGPHAAQEPARVGQARPANWMLLAGDLQIDRRRMRSQADVAAIRSQYDLDIVCSRA